MKTRSYPQSNYKAFFTGTYTVRQKHRKKEPFSRIPYPEIEDVAINNKCLANCPYCYVSAVKQGVNFQNICTKAVKAWGELFEQDRPFQIAIGGAGEPTMHPNFIDFVKVVQVLGIVPNYTTNGMHLTEPVLRATEDICGGVALSYHPHLSKVFENALEKLSELDTQLNVHVIVGEEGSLKKLQTLYDLYYEKIDNFVILPYQVAGRAKQVEVGENWNKTFQWAETADHSKLAFGALFHSWLQDNTPSFKLATYQPEIFSGYRIMDDSYRKLRYSSYNTNFVKHG